MGIGAEVGEKFWEGRDSGKYPSPSKEMFGSKRQPEYPTPPDPAYVADQQMRINRDAARSSLINQQGPFGSLNYTEGPDGMFTATSRLDPSETGAVFGAREAATNRLRQFVSRHGDNDFSADRQRYEDANYGRSKARLDPQYEDRERQLLSRLENQGITQGSTAYQRAMDDFSRERRSAYDEARTSSILSGGAEQSRMFGLRGQEFGELQGLFGLGRLASNTPRGQGSAGVGAPDFMGAAQDQYQGQLGAWGQQQANATANRHATTTGLAALISLLCSKTFKDELGDQPSVLEALATLPIKRWSYKDENVPHMGPYAEDWAARFGGDGKQIYVIDAIGVILKAIQELELRLGHGRTKPPAPDAAYLEARMRRAA